MGAPSVRDSGLPGFVQKIAPFLPTYRFGQLAWTAVGVHADPLPQTVAILVAYTVAFFLLYWRARAAVPTVPAPA